MRPTSKRCQMHGPIRFRLSKRALCGTEPESPRVVKTPDSQAAPPCALIALHLCSSSSQKSPAKAALSFSARSLKPAATSPRPSLVAPAAVASVRRWWSIIATGAPCEFAGHLVHPLPYTDPSLVGIEILFLRNAGEIMARIASERSGATSADLPKSGEEEEFERFS
jgi:hypothetical protein